MIIDPLTEGSLPSELRADVVIVGAGTMGLFMAKYLAKSAREIVIIEAGGRVGGTAQNADMAESSGKKNLGVTSGRARGLGGTSLLWGGQLAEFDELDVDDGTKRWPIAFRELRHWYDETYKELGIGERLSDAEYRKLLGNEALQHRDAERFFTAWLPQPNFARLFKNEVIGNPRVRIVLNTTVNGIVLVDGQAQALEATTAAGKKLTVRGRDFVFASGTIETCRFFLSTQRRGDVPWVRSKNIGAYFHDHLGGRAAGVEVIDEVRFREFFENGICKGLKLQPKLRMTTETRRKAFSGVCGLFSFKSSITENVSRIKELVRSLRAGAEFSRLATIHRDISALGRSFVPLVVRYIRDRRIMAFFDEAVDFHVQAEQMPIASSRIVLIDSEDLPDGLGKVRLEWQVDGRELGSIRSFVSMADSYLRERKIARLKVDPALAEGNPEFMDTLGDTYHQCGGMLMASNHHDGVVDADCRVFETGNVYVAGASVFPTSGHANSSLTALALAARLANKLRT